MQTQSSTHLAEFMLSLIWIFKKSSRYYIYKAFLNTMSKLRFAYRFVKNPGMNKSIFKQMATMYACVATSTIK